MHQRITRRQRLLVFLSIVACAAEAPAQAPRLADGQRVLFLGDSNTFAGGFIAYLDAYLLARHLDRKIELINLGLPSETVSGLSEPDHPYPRPCIFERLDRALTQTKPHLVIAAYGMNDGIYHPFDKERFAAFRAGVNRLMARVLEEKAELILDTSMPFDARAIKDRLQPEGAEKYSWLKPFGDYDGVLAIYAEHLREMKKPAHVRVVDVHQEVSEALRLHRAFGEKDYVLSRDGIHPGPMGHMLAAGAIGRALDLFVPEAVAVIDAREGKVVSGPIKLHAASADEVRWTWSGLYLPLPLDPDWKFTPETNSTVRALARGARLKITGLPWKKARLMEGEMLLGEVEPDKAGDFWIVPCRYPTFSLSKESAAFWKLAQQRQRMLGLAWLTEVGHKRPDTPKGMSLADARRKAAEMEERLRTMARPRDVQLRLAPP